MMYIGIFDVPMNELDMSKKVEMSREWSEKREKAGEYIVLK